MGRPRGSKNKDYDPRVKAKVAEIISYLSTNGYGTRLDISHDLKTDDYTVTRYLAGLMSIDVVECVRFSIGIVRGSQKYNSTEIFGELTGKRIYFLKGDNAILGHIIKTIPFRVDKGYRSALAKHLYRILGEERAKIVLNTLYQIYLGKERNLH